MILLILDHDEEGVLSQHSLEAIGFTQALAGTLGEEVAGLAQGAGAAAVRTSGLSRLLVAYPDHSYAPESFGQLAGSQAAALGARLVLAPASERGNEILTHAAVSADAEMVANAATLSADGDAWVIDRFQWAGSLIEAGRWAGTGTLYASVAANIAAAVDPTAGDAPAPEELEAPPVTGAQVAEVLAPSAGGVTLTEASVVVGGGRGVGAAGFDKLERLAGLLGGAVGVSRVVTSEGWRPHADQVGQTGSRISPDLYIACGISGAIQHMAGCKGAKRILAINTDPDAPMMSKADFTVVGDLHEIVPAIAEEIERTGARRP